MQNQDQNKPGQQSQTPGQGRPGQQSQTPGQGRPGQQQGGQKPSQPQNPGR